MNDDRNTVDRLFSEGLGNYNPSPPPELWKKIDGRQMSAPADFPPAARTRYRAIGLLVLLMSGFIAFWYFEFLKTTPSGPNAAAEKKEIPFNTTTAETKPDCAESANSDLTPPDGALKIEHTIARSQLQIHPATHFSATAKTDYNKAVNKSADSNVEESGNQYPTSVSSLPETETLQQFGALRNDFIDWLSSRKARLNLLPAPSAFDDALRTSGQVRLPKRSPIPILLGIYAGWDQIHYGNDSKKQSCSAGISLSTFSGQWIMETGVAVSLSDDNGRFMINYNSLDSIGYYNRVVSFSIDPENPGTILFNTEATGVYDSVTHADEALTANRYTYLQIPLMAGYQVYTNRRMSISLKAGPVFSVLLGSEEPPATFSQDGATVSLIDDRTPVRFTTNWQVAAGLGVGFYLFHGLTFQLEPTCKTYLRPVYRNSRTNPNSIGLKAGLLYRF